MNNTAITTASIASTLKSIVEGRKDNNFQIVMDEQEENKLGFTFEYSEDEFKFARRALKACVKYVETLKPSVNRFKKFQMFNILENPKYCFLFQVEETKFLVSLDASTRERVASVFVWVINGTDYEKHVNW